METGPIFIDGTYIKAHASNHKYEKFAVPVDALFYSEQLDKEIREDRVFHEKKALKSLTEVQKT